MRTLRILSRRETLGEVERLHVARAYPGAGAFYWASMYRVGGVAIDSAIKPARAEVARFLDEKPVALLDEESGALFTGDAVLGKLRATRPPEDVPAQMDSLRRILALAPRTVFPRTGPRSRDRKSRWAACSPTLRTCNAARTRSPREGSRRAPSRASCSGARAP